MWINEAEYKALIPPKLQDKFHTGKVLHRLMRHFCRPLASRNACPKVQGRDCSECAQYIINFLEETAQSMQRERISDAYGMLVWHIRNQRSEILEQAYEREGKTPTNSFGEPIINDQDPFSAYMKEKEIV